MKPSTTAGLIFVVLLSKTLAVSFQRPEVYSLESHTGDVDSTSAATHAAVHATATKRNALVPGASLESARDGDVRRCDCGCGSSGPDGVHLDGSGCACPVCHDARERKQDDSRKSDAGHRRS